MKSRGNGIQIAAFLSGLLWLSGCGEWGGAGGQIRILTDPAEAAISCNGIPQEASPAVLRRLPPGTYLVTASKPGYRTARRTVDLMANQRAAVELKLEPLTGLALITSVPPGADVTLDGAWRGKTPFQVTDLSQGVRTLVFESPGFLPKQMDLSVEDRVPVRAHAELIPNTGRLSVRSQPEGAEVLLNGKVRGTTPCEIPDAPAGENRVDVRLAGYVTFTESLVVEARAERALLAVLARVSSQLTVVSLPEGARVYIGDQYRGDTPLTLTDLSSETHRIRAELKGYEAMARSVTLSGDTPRTEEFRLTKNSAKLVIVSDPAGATLLLNGQEYGVTAPGDDLRASAPLEIDGLPAGDYQVQLRLRGYTHAPRTIRLGVNQVLDLREKLVRRFVADTQVRIRGQSGEMVRDGMLLETFSNGDVELQLEAGSILRLRAEDIVSVRRTGQAAP
jgi:hypothetical protein